MRSAPPGLTHALLAALLALGAPACGTGKPEETEEDKKRAAFLAAEDAKAIAKLEPKLAFLKELEGKLPPASQTEKLALEKGSPNVLWINEGNLGSPASTLKGVEHKNLALLRDCAEALRTKQTRGSKLWDCADARHAYVIRVLERVEPSIEKYGTKDAQGSYSPGSAKGDILVYDLEEKKHVGGVRWEAANSGSVEKQKLALNLQIAIEQAVEGAGLNIKRP